ncbi:hypothetical protein T4A_5348 [Trichinella pseudospiralis]|uniref:Uncharacterized protein n=1 Tax=Trichinella pseudospiralis TaxID=6337 RepID=A0A0V1DMN7_TRIPS|nr:hypothetical protein T4A_5348 [Trichinella pseudospiralis]KRY97693.1 hypothetical protein T4C_14166 [Trichinella pseudospiralis]
MARNLQKIFSMYLKSAQSGFNNSSSVAFHLCTTTHLMYK